MTLLTGYDSTNANALPVGADFYLAYGDGFKTFNNYVEVTARFPTARVLKVTTDGQDLPADLADVESGDLTPASGAALYRQGLVRALYSDTSSERDLDHAVGGPFNWWASIPGPAQLFKATTRAQVVGTQYGFQGSYDTSVALASFVNPPAPPPKEDHPKMFGYLDGEGATHIWAPNPAGHLCHWIIPAGTQTASNVFDVTATTTAANPNAAAGLFIVAP